LATGLFVTRGAAVVDELPFGRVLREPLGRVVAAVVPKVDGAVVVVVVVVRNFGSGSDSAGLFEPQDPRTDIITMAARPTPAARDRELVAAVRRGEAHRSWATGGDTSILDDRQSEDDHPG